ncbi:MAG: hypothetical protein ABW252_14400 [Polyangiales bacterium]
MRRLWLAVPFVASLVVSMSAEAQGRAPKPPADKPGPAPITADACAEARGSVRQEAYGYTHVVSLRNGCAKPVSCELWSDVDPSPRTRVEVPPGATSEVVTRRGSPAREVRGFRKCSFR